MNSERRPARRVSSVAAAFFLFFLLPLVQLSSGCGGNGFPETTLEVAGHGLTVELAADPVSRQQGLMHRKSLDEDRGMLFVFEQEGRVSFWMKDTLIPLSIAFISSDGTIRQIEEMEPLSLDSIVSVRSVRYALEVNRGWFEERGIEPGDRVVIPELSE